MPWSEDIIKADYARDVLDGKVGKRGPVKAACCADVLTFPDCARFHTNIQHISHTALNILKLASLSAR
jgi:hypothetical protein